MASFRTLDESTYVTIEHDHLSQCLRIHTGDLPIIYADHETNTFIMDRDGFETDEGFYSVREDLLRIDQLPVPYGQFCFLVYDGEGEFASWCNSDNYRTGLVCESLKKFGYTASVDSVVVYRVDDKSKFTLKLKYGY